MFEDFARPIQSEHRRARTVIVLLAIGMLADIAHVLTAFLDLRPLNSPLTVLSALTYLTTSVAFLLWMFRAYSNLPLLGARFLEYSPWWTVGCFFVPILSLFRPYQVMDEIWRASDPNEEGDQSWQWKKGPSILRWWWGLFLGMNFFGSTQALTGGDAATNAFLSVIQALVRIPAAVTAILLIRSVDERQGRGRDRLLSAPAVPPPMPGVEA